MSASDIVRLFEEDERARKRLAELLVSEPDVRLALINAVLGEVATRRDVERLEESLRRDLERLEGRVSRLEDRVSGLEGRISGLEGRVSRLEGHMARLEGRISGLEGHMAGLKDQLSLLTKVVVAFDVSLLVALAAALVKLVFS